MKNLHKTQIYFYDVLTCYIKIRFIYYNACFQAFTIRDKLRIKRYFSQNLFKYNEMHVICFKVYYILSISRIYTVIFSINFVLSLKCISHERFYVYQCKEQCYVKL